jgi:hypothetical protein
MGLKKSENAMLTKLAVIVSSVSSMAVLVSY